MRKTRESKEDGTTCSIDNKGTTCCGGGAKTAVNAKDHWNEVYKSSSQESLGWYETDLEPTLRLMQASNLKADATILNVGAGTTNLIEALLELGHSKIYALDISDVALSLLENRIQSSNVKYHLADITDKNAFGGLEPIDIWIDRAVLHFLDRKEDLEIYKTHLSNMVKPGGYVLLAQYALDGASRCAGLSVHRYDLKGLQEFLGDQFDLVEAFDYTYTMPSGDLRPYTYTLFKNLA
ncbi:MAG: hypothetical protein RL754_1037 [Bacteroidota bacterium]|jgi:2-polyprenyl-3-methyl-5-hydroxy-6-metoxy-1,4-benzoquinol methylase